MWRKSVPDLKVMVNLKVRKVRCIRNAPPHQVFKLILISHDSNVLLLTYWLTLKVMWVTDEKKWLPGTYIDIHYIMQRKLPKPTGTDMHWLVTTQNLTLTSTLDLDVLLPFQKEKRRFPVISSLEVQLKHRFPAVTPPVTLSVNKPLSKQVVEWGNEGCYCF